MRGISFRLLVILLSFSYLIFLNAAPITRSRNLMRKSQVYRVLTNTHLENTEESFKGERIIRRVDVEINDYPGSGANHRHTPNPKLGRGCVDC
ncbi:50S ribosomal protein [Actinidia chinensis var. chinensis]|uniref:50S ribosomal protein n=1 Tax=Actinidia chinensis var. chinensis TaxID=1590841 RepID=A0A2R6PUE6_ACTCC|nr:50S ribosomal protein [Actinidia chinensis var. chinensis]